MGTFKIVCPNCGKEAIIDDLWLNGSTAEIQLYTLIGGCISIWCKCGNELKNFTDEDEE